MKVYMRRKAKSQLLNRNSSQVQSEIKVFTFPNTFQRPHSEVLFNPLAKRNCSSRNLRNISTSKSALNLSLPYNTSIQPVVHNYALPGKILMHKKQQPRPSLEKFNKDMREIMKRFNKNLNYQHYVKLETNEMRGAKKNSILAIKLLRDQYIKANDERD